MGTTAEKLNYLKETKTEIKNALETPSNIFRDYPSLIKKYIDNQLTSKVSNGVCTNALDVPIVRVGIDGNSYQGENPSPDNPQDIEVIEGFEEGNQYGLPHGCIGLEQSGKNLINLKESINKTDSGVTITCDEERQVIHFKGTISNTYCTSGLLLLPETISSGIFRVNFKSNCDAFIVFRSNDGTWLRSIQSLNNVQIDISSLSKPVTGLQFGIEHFASGDTVDFEVGYQLTKGSELKPYEPYHSPKVYPINLNGNSLSKVGDVKDLLKIYRNGDVEIGKKINKIMLNGTEDWHKNADSPDGNYISFYIIEYWIGNIIPICDKFVGTEWTIIEGENGEFCWSATVSCGFRIRKDRLNGYLDSMSDDEKIQLFKSWLSQNPTEVYYPLATSQTIQLPSIEPIELWEGTNNFKLITNLDTTFEVEYIVNKDSVLNEVQTAMLEAEIEI